MAKQSVKGIQNVSNMCIVCGQDNAFSLNAHFYNLENGDLYGVFTPKEEHQSYPGRLHGGVASAVLDEAIGRAITSKYGGEEDLWGVTMELSTRFRKPLPLDEDLRVIARVDKETSRTFEGSGEILLGDGSVAVEGTAIYAKLPVEKIADGGLNENTWRPDTNFALDEVEL